MASLVSEQHLELVFEKRNKDYGAYIVRKLYDRSVVIALIASIALFVFFLSLPLIIELLTPAEEVVVEEPVVYDPTTLKPPPMTDVPPPPPPAFKVEVPEQMKFIPPEIVPEKDIEKDEMIKDIEEIKDQPVATGPTGPTTSDPFASGPPVAVEDPNAGNEIVTSVSKMPKEGVNINDFVNKNVSHAKIAPVINAGISGKVWVNFVVEKDGSVSDVKIARSVHKVLDAEAERIVKMLPKWQPAEQNGRPVRFRFTIPITFAGE